MVLGWLGSGNEDVFEFREISFVVGVGAIRKS
jgi:hypothetical protein